MEQTSADVLTDTLIDWGVTVVFGMPGDGINGMMEALRKRQDRIRFLNRTSKRTSCSWILPFTTQGSWALRTWKS